MKRTIPLIVCALLVGCGKKDPDAGSTAKPHTADRPKTAAAPALRLPDDAAPLRYRASLEVDPKATSFKGHVEIDVTIKRAVDVLWLNAQDLTIARAVVRRGGAETPLTARAEPRNFVALHGALAAGEATLVIDYEGTQSAQVPQGMGIHTDAGDAYALTHFEPHGARRVFPSFDEPGFKVPWQIELTVPAGNAAFANTPVDEETTLPDGRKKTRFRATPPLPSYLIAVAVGPFDTVDAGKTRSGVATRIIVPRGRGGDAAYAAREVGKVLAALEDYTGIPYPYEKLDHIVVPGSLRGAMEHPGLITYGPRYLLIPASESAAVRRAHVGIVAHELAHQWFGNLVTLAWWDDLWLNEAFATWATPKTIAATHKEMDAPVDMVGTRNGALAADALTSARKIRQPITCEADMEAAFDSITYAKGATVIRMFERWLGEDVFQKAVRQYLDAHKNGNATATDFLGAVDAAAGKPLGAAFATFLDQAGAPQVDMELRCPARGPATLGLSQHRHVPAGAAPVTGESLWQVPVCVAVPDGKSRKTFCTLLAAQRGEIALGATCPAWVVPNVDGAGYYVANLPGVLDKAWPAMTRVERLAALGDVSMLVDAGAEDVTAILKLLPSLGASEDPYVVDVAVGRLEKLAHFVGPEHKDAFAKLVRDTLGAQGKRLGWTPRAHEPLADAKLRGRLMSLLAVEGADAAARDRAVKLTKAWVADHKAVPESLWGYVLASAVRARPSEVFPALFGLAPKESDRTAQRTIYSALAQVPDIEMHAKVLGLVGAANPITLELMPVLWVGRDTVALEAAVFDFVRDNFDALLAHIPRDNQGSLGQSICDAARRDEVAKFLHDKLEPLPDVGVLAVAHDIEYMDQCIARRAAQTPALAKFLAGR